MLDPISVVATIAQLLGVGLELAKHGQKIHKHANTAKKSTGGYVYVVQEVDYSNKFLVGSANSNVNWLSELSAKYPGQLKPILVIPTESTGELEGELNSLCATHLTDGDWFDLSPAQVTKLRQLQVVVDLAAGSFVSSTQQLDSDDLERAKRLFEMLSNASRNEERHKEVIPDAKLSDDMDLKSLPPVNYRSLPKLKGRSGYLLVIRNAENRLHRIDGAKDPVRYIDEALAWVNHRFGLELALVLESARVNLVKENLSILYPADDRNGWRRLSAPQLQEIRKLATRVKVHRPLIITPKTHWGIQTCSIRKHKNLPKLKGRQGYVCVVQGTKRGNRYKIWRTHHPKDSGGIFGMAGQLNNPHDALHSREPVRFRCIIRADYAKEFEGFLMERYKGFRNRGDLLKRDDWYKLTKVQLREICNFGK